MATATLTRRDTALRDAVMHQLEWDPEVDATAVGVAAYSGAVTLAGFIGTYAGKLAAERAAKRVKGVRAVANELQVRLRIAHPDDVIARQAAATLNAWHEPHPGVQAAVHNGHVVLTGTVRWIFQKEWAEESLRHIPGVVAITNRIVVWPDAETDDLERRIIQALRRTADVDARRIKVAVDGRVVTLSGEVETWAQREAAQRTASAAPGVNQVQNLIEVTGTPDGDGFDPEC
jgi:osmotically-inducible protein OsmY